ncbi:hypothetical protein [Megamonas funiformis]|uniref:YobI family P-loop NTPase n=1 Tax=Megamonas funiformis TaxID=437897 RepID=UPI0039F54DE7
MKKFVIIVINFALSIWNAISKKITCLINRFYLKEFVIRSVLFVLNIINKKAAYLIDKFNNIIDKPDLEKYKKLSPIDDMENGDEYIDALDWAIKHKDIKNIAITAPYGAGKSSVIKTYVKKHPSLKYTFISMATFNGSKEKSQDDEKKEEIPLEKIENVILKQFFYKVKKNMLPQSRYNKIEKMSYMYIFIWIFCIDAFCLIGSVLFFPDILKEKVINCTNFFIDLGIPEFWTRIIIPCLVLLELLILTIIIKQGMIKLKLKEIKLFSNATLGSEAIDEKSIFNKNIDEILYFFEATGYEVVFFEDLDRLENNDIFIELRDLNFIINNYEGLKKPVKFVYAVKDELFHNKEERTKFFDYIIPVIPIINESNSEDVFLKEFENNTKCNISKEYIKDIAPFVSDMRVLYNIFNEFKIYKRTLKDSDSIKLVDEKMLSLIIFKNLYPKDFAELQNEQDEGIVKQAFKNKQSFIEKSTKKIREDINELEKQIISVKEDYLKDTKEIKYAFCGHLVDWKGSVRKIERYDKEEPFYIEKILDDDFNLKDIYEDKSKYTIYYADSSHDNEWKDINSNELKVLLESYDKRWTALKLLEDKKMDDIHRYLEGLNEQLQNISILSLKELIDRNDVKEVLSDNVRSNKVLVFMLRYGYIDEYYSMYINYFKGDSITKDDMNFILNIRNREVQSFDYKLTRLRGVVDRLNIRDFKQKEVYNFYLLEYLLSNSSKEIDKNKLDNFIQQLADEKKESWSFIDAFVRKNNNRKKFINLLALKWENMWIFLTEKAALTYNRQIEYFKWLCESLKVEELLNLNKDKAFEHFFEENEDILMQLKDVNINYLEKIIEKLEIHFYKLNIEGVDRELLNFIFDNKHYDINKYMIDTILMYKNSEINENDLNKKNYTMIMTSGYDCLINNVFDYIEEYVKEIILSNDNNCDDEKYILDLMTKCSDDMDLVEKIIVHEDFKLKNISVCENKYWILLLKHRKINASYDNIIQYWKQFSKNELDKELIDFLSTECDAILNSDRSFVEEKFIKDLSFSDIDNNIFEKYISHLRLIFNDLEFDFASMNQEKLKILIQNKYIPLNKQCFEKIKDVSVEMVTLYILSDKDNFIDNIEEFQINEDVFSNLLEETGRTDKVFCQKIVNYYGRNFMNEYLKKVIFNTGITLTKDLFKIVFDKIDNKRKLTLLVRHLDLFNADELENLFSKMDDEYKELSNREKRRDIHLPINSENERLCIYLQKIKYISNKNIYDKEQLLFRIKVKK